jgi:hypothetical protein
MPAERIGREILQGRKLLLWVGAGNSCSAGIPADSSGDGGLAHRIALIHFGNPETVRRELGNDFRIAELAARIGKPRVRDLIRQQAWWDLQVADAHRAIAALASEGRHIEIVTTNYDPLLEKALREAGLSPEIISSAATVRKLSEEVVTVVKVHGCPYTEYDPNNLVMLQDELAQPPAWVVAFLNGRMQERVFVYVGFSGNAEYVRAAITTTANNLQGELNVAYAVDRVPRNEVFDNDNSLRQFYGHCRITADCYSDEGSDTLLAEVANYVFRSILLESLEAAIEQAQRHDQVDARTLRSDINRMTYTAIRCFAKKLGCLSAGQPVQVRHTCIMRAFKWMLLLSARGILESASFRPVLAFPFHPGPQSSASAPVIFVDGLGEELLVCRDQTRELARSVEFQIDFETRGLPRWYLVILNCTGTTGEGQLEIIQREQDSTVGGYDPMICIDENSLLDAFPNIADRFAV